MSAAALIDRLRRVRETGPGRWVACCPAHDDKTPSLTVRELDDGRVLVKCFAGCEVADVLAAVGLAFPALYPPRAIAHRAPGLRQPFPAADVLAAAAGEAILVAVIAGRIRDGAPVSTATAERAALAAGRLAAAAAFGLPTSDKGRARRIAQKIVDEGWP